MSNREQDDGVVDNDLRGVAGGGDMPAAGGVLGANIGGGTVGSLAGAVSNHLTGAVVTNEEVTGDEDMPPVDVDALGDFLAREASSNSVTPTGDSGVSRAQADVEANEQR